MNQEIQDRAVRGEARKATGMRAIRPTGCLSLEVVIPAWHGAECLDRCLRGLFAAGVTAERVVVVDDASSDGTAALAVSHGVRVIRHGRRRGAAAARNSGTAACRADLILFVDADVVVHFDILHHVRRTFADSTIAAVFGSYNAEPAALGLVSQYRNLLHHYVHQHANREAVTFWTGCGVVRRQVLLAVGGFDPTLPYMEDIDLGMRLRAVGWRIRLEQRLLCTHLKHWSLAGMIRTDLLHRAIPWSRLLLAEAHALPNDLALDRGQRLAVALTGIAAGALALAPARPEALWLAVLAGAGVLAINRRFFAFLARERGPGFAAAAFPLHLGHHACAGLGFVIALLERAPVVMVDRFRPGAAVRRLIARQ